GLSQQCAMAHCCNVLLDPDTELRDKNWPHRVRTWSCWPGLVLSRTFFLGRNHLNIRLNGLRAWLGHSRVAHTRLHCPILLVHWRRSHRFASGRTFQLLQILGILGLAHRFVAVLASRQPKSKRHCHKSCRYFLHNLPLLPLVVRVRGSMTEFPLPYIRKQLCDCFA